ncbi:MAG: HEAT repeat domain-containing protein [Candidatus Kariarchaeaceae archaeon]|jgi:hypothetical protein
MAYNEYINSDATQAELKKIAVSNENEFIRGSAIRKLLDQQILEKLAINDPNSFIRTEAALKIVDQKKLAIIAETDPSPDVRRSAISSLENLELLKQICLEDLDDHVRETAVKQLNYSCQDILSRVATEDPNWMVRHAAIWKIRANGENDDVLHKIAREDSHEEVRKAAVDRLTGENLLHDIVMKDLSEKVKLSGILKINKNQALLSDIAVNCTATKIREIAVSKIDNQNLLKIIAVEDRNRWVREQAVNNMISDGDGLEYLTKIAMNDSDENVRYSAIKKIKADSYLGRIVRESQFNDSVKVAIKNMCNIETLAVLRMTAKLEIQKEIAERIKQLKDQQ